MIKKGLSGAAEDSGKFGPGIRGAHIHNSNSFDSEFRRLDTEEARGLAALDAALEFALGSDNEMLIERIGMGGDLDPFAAPGDN